MSQMTWPRKGTKTFEFGRGGDKMEYLFAAALAIVIVGALVLTVYFAFMKRPSSAADTTGYRWQCQKCSTEISVDQATQRRLEEMDRTKVDCPKCGSSQPALPMVRCFNASCGKYFVRESLKNARKSVSDDTCPFCGKNWMQGMQERRAKK